MQDLKLCEECGKDMPASMHVCPECGAGRPRTRREKEAAASRFEPPASQVAAMTEALREVPLPPPSQRRSERVRRKHRYTEPLTAPEPQEAPAHVERRRSSREKSRGPAGELVTTEVRAPAGVERDGAVMVKRVARRKVYRYGESKKPKFAYTTELRAIIAILVIGVVALLVCRVTFASAAPLPSAPHVLPDPARAAVMADAAPALPPPARQPTAETRLPGGHLP